MLTLSGSTLLAQDRFTYEFARVKQARDVPRFEVAFYNTATDFEDESLLYVQVKVVNDALQFIKGDGNQFRADFEVTASLLDTAGTEIEKRTWSEHVLAANFDEVNARDLFLLTQSSFFVQPGYYKFRVELKDAETGRIGRMEGSMTPRDFSRPDFAVSDVLILDSANFKKIIEHSSVHIETNGQLEWSGVFAYYEVYNVPKGDSIEIHYDILDVEGKSLKRDAFSKVSAGRITPAYFELAADLVFAGRNRLNLNIYSGSDSIAVEQDRIDPFKQVSYPIFAELADSIKKLKYIAKGDELKTMRAAKGQDQLDAFLRFWKKRDPSPQTPENEYLEEYYRRIAVANRNFRGLKKGWETDRGHVYIMLGNPDFIQTPNDTSYDLSSLERYPIIYWTYSTIRRTVIFRHRAGEYRIENYYSIGSELSGEIRM